MKNILLVIFIILCNFQVKICSSNEIINLILFGIQFNIWTLFLLYYYCKKYLSNIKSKLIKRLNYKF